MLGKNIATKFWKVSCCFKYLWLSFEASGVRQQTISLIIYAIIKKKFSMYIFKGTKKLLNKNAFQVGCVPPASVVITGV